MVKGADLVLEPLAPARARGEGSIEDSHLEKTVPGGALPNLCVALLPRENIFLRLPEDGPAPVVSPAFLLEHGSGGMCPARLVAAGQRSCSNPIWLKKRHLPACDALSFLSGQSPPKKPVADAAKRQPR